MGCRSVCDRLGPLCLCPCSLLPPPLYWGLSKKNPCLHSTKVMQIFETFLRSYALLRVVVVGGGSLLVVNLSLCWTWGIGSSTRGINENKPREHAIMILTHTLMVLVPRGWRLLLALVQLRLEVAMNFGTRGSFDPSLRNHREPIKKKDKRRNRNPFPGELATKFGRIRYFKSIPYVDYLLTPHWKKKRTAARKHHGVKCNRCGSRKNLHVHHKTYERLGAELMSDLELLCRGCHENEHEGSKPWIKDPMTREFIGQFEAY